MNANVEEGVGPEARKPHKTSTGATHRCKTNTEEIWNSVRTGSHSHHVVIVIIVVVLERAWKGRHCLSSRWVRIQEGSKQNKKRVRSDHAATLTPAWVTTLWQLSVFELG